MVHIAHKFAAHGLGFFVSKLDIRSHLPAWVRVRLTGKEPVELPDLPERFAGVLEELGPTFVKFGQMLATRPDVLPQQYTESLERICHHVAPFPAEVSRSIIEQELGRPVEELFEEFSPEPLASGSMAQVHAGRLRDGTPVVIKVKRPGIEKTIDDDLAIMEFLAGQADRVEEFAPLRLPMLVEEFARGIRRELNFLTEAANTHRFHAAFQGRAKLLAPEVHWDYTTPRVLVLGRIEGAHISELARGPEDARFRSDVARLLLDCYLMQFFEIGSFHADPHPGNILVGAEPGIALIDFGLVGHINEDLRSKLGTYVMAVGNQQLELAAEVLAEIGSVSAGASTEQFRSEVSALLDRYYSIPFEKIDLQRFFADVMEIVRECGVVMPRDFVLLGKTLVTIGGIVRRLDPTMNIARVAAPYARKLAREKISAGSVRRAVTSNAYHLAMLLKSAPRDVRELLTNFKRGAFDLTVRHTGLDRYLVELDRTGNRLSLSIILAAIIISSSLILAQDIGPKVAVPLIHWEVSALGLLGYLLGFVLGLWLVFGIFRSGRV